MSIADKHVVFCQVFLPYSYDPDTVAQDSGVPLHSGAARYYQEVGYLKEAVAPR